MDTLTTGPPPRAEAVACCVTLQFSVGAADEAADVMPGYLIHTFIYITIR